MGGLRGCMDDYGGANRLHQVQNPLALSYVYGMVLVAGNLAPKPRQRPRSVALRPEEDGSLVPVQAHHPVALPREVDSHL